MPDMDNAASSCHIAYLLFGSNMGDREGNFRKAVSLLSSLGIGTVDVCSSVYESDPVGFSADERFLNMVVRIRTGLSPENLLDGIQSVEKMLGRLRIPGTPLTDSSGRRIYFSRTMDIDILFYDSMVIHTARLDVPHPRMGDRLFTMLPLAELASGFVHPETGTAVSELLEECLEKQGDGGVRVTDIAI